MTDYRTTAQSWLSEEFDELSDVNAEVEEEADE